MAFAPLCAGTVTLRSPSPSPSVAAFRAFLESSGAVVEDNDDGFSVAMDGWAGDITAGGDIPEAALHAVVAGAVCSGRRVTVIADNQRRRTVAEHIAAVLGRLIPGADKVTFDGDRCFFAGASYADRGEFAVRSAWALETAAAAAMATGAVLTVSCPPQTVSHTLNMLSMLGYGAFPADGGGIDSELARRMAKAAGDPSPLVRRLEPSGAPAKAIDIPGDTRFAAALALIAAVCQKSGIRILDVLWEQSRRGFFDSIRRMKANVDYVQKRRKNGFDTADVTVKWGPLEGIHVTSGQALTCTSELVLIGAAAVFASGETVISDADDGPGLGRGPFVALSEGLEILGSHVGDYSDGIIIRGGQELRGNLVDACEDPSAALAFTAVGMNITGDTAIFGFDDDSFPIGRFLEILKTLE